MTNQNERALPKNLDAESGVLGSILLSPDCIDEVAAVVRPDDFFSPANGIIFSHATALHNSGKVPDPRLLVATLKKAGEFEDDTQLAKMGGQDYLLGLFDKEPTAFNAVYYARMVREAAALRGLIVTCKHVAESAYDYDADPERLLTEAETRIAAIAETGREKTETDVRDVLTQAMARLPEAGVAANQSGIVTGYIDLDKQLGGLQPGQLVILAGRPSMGKTALAANIAERVAVDCGEPVLFFSLEMSLLELVNRMLFGRARVPYHKSSSGFLSQLERGRLVSTQAEFSKSKIQLDESASPTVSQMAATARRVKRKHGLGLVVIDYLQLISPDNPRDPRQEQVAKIARNLKTLAKSLKVPILCLAQLNRQTEMGTDHRPRLSHLRESGAIEQDADVVLFCHREEYYATTPQQKDELKGKADIIIAKQRNGPTGPVPMTWLAEFMRFETAASNYDVTPHVTKSSTGNPVAYTPPRGRAFDVTEHQYPGAGNENAEF